MGLEPTTLRDLVGCSNHWATGDSMVSEGQFVGLDWNRIARLHSQVLVSTCENSLTASRCHIKAYQDAANQPPKWALILLNMCVLSVPNRVRVFRQSHRVCVFCACRIECETWGNLAWHSRFCACRKECETHSILIDICNSVRTE